MEMDQVGGKGTERAEQISRSSSPSQVRQSPECEESCGGAPPEPPVFATSRMYQ